MIGVKYTFANDPSGYGEAARSFIKALYIGGVNVTTEPIKQMGEREDFYLPPLENRDIDYKVKIIHLTPDLYPIYSEEDKYNIGHLFWETDALPREWVEPLNKMNEIWTASEPMKKMIQKEVNVPVYCFPQPIDTTRAYENIKPFDLPSSDFRFYSIFQWIARKNPRTLLRAYWKEFQNENVTLLLKTYRVTYNEFDLIKNEIEGFRAELKLKSYPKVYLIKHLLSEKEVYRLHKTGQVFIQPSSGEGWSRPTQEAMLMGNPIITGSNGGLTDLLPPQLYNEVESRDVGATVQSFIPWYTSEMNWKELSEDSLREKMRYCYENFKEAKKVADKAKEYIIDNFSYAKVGQMCYSRIAEIYGEM